MPGTSGFFIVAAGGLMGGNDFQSSRDLEDNDPEGAVAIGHTKAS
jgi:hypothetical protein